MNADNEQKSDFLTIFLFWLVGADLGTMKRCPPHDWGVIRQLGILMCCTWLYQAGLFSLIGEQLFAQSGQFRPEIVFAAAFIATFIMQIDSVMIIRPHFFACGVRWLKTCGVDISGGQSDRIRAIFSVSIRAVLSITIAQLTAIFVSLLVFASTILAKIDADDLRANATAISRANSQIEQQIARETDAYNSQNASMQALLKQIGSLRQNVVDPAASDSAIASAEQEVNQLVDRQAKDADDLRTAEVFASNEKGGVKHDTSNSGQPGEGPRYQAALDQIANAKTHSQQTEVALASARARLEALRKQVALTGDAIKQQAHDQLPAFESQLTTEQTKVATMKAHLDELTRDRERAVQAAVEASPEHVARDTGFLARISALEEIAASDSRIAVVILLIDVTSFGFELAAVLAISSMVPTKYSALLAAQFYKNVVRIVDGLASELNPADAEPPTSPEIVFVPEEVTLVAANDNDIDELVYPDGEFGSTEDNRFDDHEPPDPPKRGRGRPRKSSLN